MEDKVYQVQINPGLTVCGGGTPPSGSGSAGASGGGGGSGEVNDNNYNNNVNSGVVVKRKRGRPKKIQNEAQPVLPISSPYLGFPSPSPIQPPVKRGRGRPKGSGSKQIVLPVSPPPGAGFEEEGKYGYGVNLTPHILPIYTGEDIHGRILSFAQSGNRAITVLSCNGPVARISMCSPGSAGGMVYEGNFEILTLNGTFTCVGTEGSYHRRGMLTISLSKPNGEVFGGCVSGPIIAAGPVQLILCSFDQVKRPPNNNQFQNYPVAAHLPEVTPPPPVATAAQAAVAKPTDQIQELDQDKNKNNVSSINRDRISNIAPVDPTSSAQPLADTEPHQLIEASFGNPGDGVPDL